MSFKKDIIEEDKSNVVLVFRDKLLLPSEGFILSHYTGFEALQPVFLANQLGWQDERISGIKLTTANGPFGRFLFKQFGRSLNIESIRKLSPIALHAHFGRGGALALPIAQTLGLPLFVTFHGGDATKHTHSHKRLIPTVYQRRLASLQAYSSGFLCVSNFVANRLELQGFPKNKLMTHYIGIKLAHIIKPRKRSGRLLFMGRLVGKKGVDTLISAIKILATQNISPGLDIAGSGPDEPLLRKLVSNEPSIRFLGWQQPEKLADYLDQCMAVVVPSREAENGDCEGLPTVVLEALRAGAPVIATRHAGIPEIISHNHTGLLVDEGDAVGLAAQIRHLYETPEIGPKLVEAGQNDLKKRFNSDTQSARLESIFMNSKM